MNWKAGLDRYLTSSPPDDGFNEWCDMVNENFYEDFFCNNTEWIFYSEQSDLWFNELFNRVIEPELADGII